ncbi:biotin synthase BioB [Clostridium sp. DJ247]|uniref:biotin synthase BioB n=1 Tax=Clostridium sp. DJ247 TaxID=2726188 RepID=UPI00162A7584|nr:biotin synthase BioB [Clostridium sp. DJ247]MBC2582871.1 biotin synthase BioB [Clostridium sp. DJ247]
MKNLITKLEEKIDENGLIGFEEALELSKVKDLDMLFKAGDRIREKYNGNKVDLCGIINGKSGKCSEDCKYCAQSAHYHTDVKNYGVVEAEEVLKQALEDEKGGVDRFGIVTSGRGLQGEEFEKILKIYEKLRKNVNIDLCASLGIISYEQLLKLKEVGVTSYHHNLETCREYYKNICTTHTYDERIDTINNAMKAGLCVCSGGIIGMGETMEDRIKLALELQKLEVKSIPVNILNPIKGTPLENMKRLDENEILITMTIFRFINPKASIRLAGGRNFLHNYGEESFKVGVNATITGNMLTTSGNNIEEDIQMIRNLGLEVANSKYKV